MPTARNPSLRRALFALLASQVFTLPAAAEPNTAAVETFERICLSPAVPTPVAAARADGFVIPPPRFTDEFSRDAPFPGATILWKAVEGKLLIMMAGDGPFPDSKELAGEACTIMSMPAEDGVERRLEARLGVGAGERQKDGARMLTFQEDAGTRSLVDPSQALALVRLIDARKLHMVMYGTLDERKRDSMSILLLMTPRPK